MNTPFDEAVINIIYDNFTLYYSNKMLILIHEKELFSDFWPGVLDSYKIICSMEQPWPNLN